MAQVERLYWMDGVMQTGAHLHWKVVVEKFEVNRRTVFGDMAFLRDRLGAPIDYSHRYGGWYYTAPGYHLPFLALSDTEADTLRLTLLAALAYLPSTDAAAARRLAMRLSPYVRQLPTQGGILPTSQEVFLSGHPALAPHLVPTDDLLADVRRAIDDNHRLQITYYAANNDETTVRVIRPYLLLNRGGELYLTGYCELRDELRDFGIHRIRERIVLEPAKAFAIPDTFNKAAYLEHSFNVRRGEPLVTVRVRFSKLQARWVKERIYHPSQTLTEEADGTVVVSLRVSGTEEVKRWVLSFGEQAEVLEPESLRSEMKNKAKNLFDLY